ncbi:MAG TPA: PLP-dependent aminotransferase family protein [Dyella sp.]|uniref:aminotransferase-like domain-containing protein n=1 Tax=Dyella sp. TaxID=1869338 RepID=UPI002D79D255|nr:PLP-dependent aminotransferase family protein [Dyella sp.]HET6554219.1 PLP-dependent aminotransferase family protein [Dyella sp.]
MAKVRQLSWTPRLPANRGPMYLAIADAIGEDIQAGRLSSGDRLPPIRALADWLGIDFTTVTRAYAEAARRELVDAEVGRGTFVRKRALSPPRAVTVGAVEMSMNHPPAFHDAALLARMWKGAREVEDRGAELLMRYQPPGGGPHDRDIAAHWLAARIDGSTAERTLVTSGLQGGLHSVMSMLLAPGDTLAVESLTYPGVRALAALLRIRLVPVAMDEHGVQPDALDAVCQSAGPKAFYCMPTLHNPTTITMPLARREEVVAVMRRHNLPIIEDEDYGSLPSQRPPPLAALAPELTYHIAGLSKCLSPSLVVAFVLAPDAWSAARLTSVMRATSGTVSSLSAAVTSRWIEDGTAAQVVKAIRDEALERMGIAGRMLPRSQLIMPEEGFHVWLRLPEPWTSGEFVGGLRHAGLGVVGHEAFSVGPSPEAVRLALGASATREQLKSGLGMVADLLVQVPMMSSTFM